MSRAAKAWRRAELLAIDTEFVRERTYFARLGLVQLSDGHSVWLLDPLAEGALEPLRELLEDRGVTKVLHSPSEDLEVLLNVVGAVPAPLIDTQLACALAGQTLQLGYHLAAEWLLGVTVEKDQTRSNWCARPLRPAQRRYAALDVCVLPLMWESLRERLEEHGRLSWLEEDCARLLEDASAAPEPEALWRRIRGHGRLDGVSLAVLARLADWREREAIKRDRPRGFIVPDTVLLQIATEKPRDANAMTSLEGLHPRARGRYGKALTGIVERVLASGEQLPTVPTPTTGQRRQLRDRQLRDLRAATAAAARELEIEPALLASRREMELAVLGDGQQGVPARWRGWRWQFLEQPCSRILGEA
ncbi:MAG: ribonuclease D [Gammaproteobacteria bacterium]